jgi:hypothetical protein
MEKKRTLYSLESDIRRILEDNDFVSTCDERGKQWYINLVSDLAIYIQQELDKAREEGYEQGYKECKKDFAVGVGMHNDPEFSEIVSKVAEKLSKLKDNK